jgi:hypothetical protein
MRLSLVVKVSRIVTNVKIISKIGLLGSLFGRMVGYILTLTAPQHRIRFRSCPMNSASH